MDLVERRPRRRQVLFSLLVAVGLLASLTPSAAKAAATGTIQGRVRYDGATLAHVSVFLLDPGVGPRHACTNANGFYKFEDVTAGDGIIMATGPGDCLNRYFVGDDGENLLTQWYLGDNGVPFPQDTVTLSAGEILRIVFRPIAANGPSCGGMIPTIKGTSGDDVLHGTAGLDIIVGRAGSDQIFGHGGDDFLCGGGGSDIINGGPGNDWLIFGGTGKDVLRGRGGSDFLDGGMHVKDVLNGGGGSDTCYDPDGWIRATCEIGP